MKRGLSLSRSLLALTVIVALFTLSGCAGAPAATTVPAEPTVAVATSAPTEAATEEATEAATEVATEAATAEVTEEVTAETPEAAGGAAGGTQRCRAGAGGRGQCRVDRLPQLPLY